MTQNRLMMRRVKGEVILKDIDYLNKKRGKKGQEDMLSKLNLDIREISSERWYPLEWHTNLLKKVDAEWGSEDTKRSEEIGRYAVANLGGLLRYIVRFAGMEKLMKSLPKTYSEMYDSGSISLESLDMDQKRAIYRHHDVSNDLALCSGWKGAYLGFFDLQKKKGTVEEVACVHYDSPYCEFVLNWE